MWLTLVRHAESVSNQEGVLSGHSRSPLTAEGRRQAACLGGCRPELANGRVISSDLLPARQFVALALGTDVRVTIDARWRKRDFGAFDGLPLGREPRPWRATPGDGVARRTSAVLGVPPRTGANPDSAGATGFWTTQMP